MTAFLTLLSINNKLLNTEDDSEAGLLETLRSQICDNITMYAQKYDEEFKPYLPSFVTAVWHLLVNTGAQVKYDLLVSNAIQFLATVADRQHYKHLFEDQNTLTSICEKVIVPNIEVRPADEEQFEDNPEEYIRRDIEGSDFDTRRRSACDLVRALCKFFEKPVTDIFAQYVQALLQEFSKDSSANWKCKDTAIFLVTSVAAKAQTQKHGITQTSGLVNVADFFTSTIVPELQAANINTHPVLKADCIKYIMIFRNQLPKELIVGCLPVLVKYLGAQAVVVHSYAAHALERLFTVKTPQGHALILKEDVHPVAESLVSSLFNALSLPGSSENEYIMKAIMRTVSLLQEAAVPYIPAIIPKLNHILLVVSKNPSKPHFNHYLFEVLSLCIKVTCTTNPESITSFEDALFPPFQEILTQDCQEFIPYVFQILSLLLEMHKGSVPNSYMALYPHLLIPILWERPGNIPALVRLLQAFIEHGKDNVVAGEKLTGLLGIFQKLMASKSNDHEGFYLMSSIVQHISPELLDHYMKQVFLVLFQRLTSSKTTKYVKGLLVFFSLFAWLRGVPALIQIIDSIQVKMFGMVLERLYIADVQKVAGNVERKICAVGMTLILTECPEVFKGDYSSLWLSLLQTLIGLFELPQDESLPDDEHFIEVEDMAGYQTAYSRLVFAGKPEPDPFNGKVPDAKLYLAKQLHKLSTAYPGEVTGKISSGLAADAAKCLQTYLQGAAVTVN